MKRSLIVCGVLTLAIGLVAGTVRAAEDPQLLKAKVGLLVDQAADLYRDPSYKRDYVKGAAYQYYFGLMYATGTNLLARASSTTNERLLRKYLELIEKDYEAYTKVAAASGMAAATGSNKGKSGSRHRVKRLINAEKLQDQELATAVKRWERFVGEVKASAKR